jgi:hypothetical protein
LDPKVKLMNQPYFWSQMTNKKSLSQPESYKTFT